MSKDADMLHDLADALQGDNFFNLVAEEMAKLKGVPFTEAFRRETVARLRNETSVTIGPTPPKPN